MTRKLFFVHWSKSKCACIEYHRINTQRRNNWSARPETNYTEKIAILSQNLKTGLCKSIFKKWKLFQTKHTYQLPI